MCARTHVHVRHRRAAVAVYTAVSMTFLLGFAALTIDLGYLYVVRAQLQNAADAAALAAASIYLEDVGIAQDESEMTRVATSRAQAYSFKNDSMRRGTKLAAVDVTLGRHDFDNPKGPMLSDGRWNAAEVTVRATPGSLNGAVPLFFAAIFGRTESGIIATARAVADDRFQGYRARYETVLIPFTIQEDLYADMAEDGLDDFTYDHDAEDPEVGAGADGVREVILFPWKWQEVAGPDGVDGSGNFGTLNVGLGGEGTAFLEDQIQYGITPEQLEAEFGTSEIVFYDDQGNPVTYESTGNPGVSTGMQDTIEARVGHVIGFFVHDTVVFDGANAIYTITGIRFGVIVDVTLTGKPDTRALVIQPVPYTDGNIIVGDAAPSTEGKIGRIMLAR
jgi:Flp pilus assembly protein TadG